jgi:DNA polymerase-3 subunit delta
VIDRALLVPRVACPPVPRICTAGQASRGTLISRLALAAAVRYIEAMAKPIDALDYLAHPAKHPATNVCALFGDEPFLKRQVLAVLKEQVLSGDDAEFSVTVFDGREAPLVEVLDALATRALFGGGRHLVVVDEADDFVSENRAALEDYVASPRAASLLVLDVKQWPSTTRLAKAVAAGGLAVECKFPAPARLAKWLAGWAKRRHAATLEPAAAEGLIESTEPDLGLLDQELAKLAALAGNDGAITPELVRQSVGGWRVQTAWEMLDAALAGDARTALVQLDRLLISGEVPIALLAQISSGLRRMAAAAQLVEQAERARRRVSLRQALEQAGVKPFLIGKIESQMRTLGRQRAGKLYRWLLQADLALKGSSSAPARARLVLEELIVRLSAPAPSGPRRPAATAVR